MATNDNLQLLLADGVAVDWIINSSSSNTIIADNNWHHYLVVGDATNVFFQIDGVRETGTDTMGTKSSGDSTGALRMGTTPDSGFALDGNMALVRFYNIALSETIGQDHYRQERHLFGM